MATIRRSWHGDRVKRGVHAAAVDGVRRAAWHLHGVSTSIAPIDDGILIATAGVDVDEASARASVYYITPYAVRQHEELSYRHEPGRQAKYLEQPHNTERAAMLALIAAQIRPEMR